MKNSETLKSLQKQKMEEKKEEMELLGKIRKVKLRNSIGRREQPGRKEQPPQKRRKLGEDEFKRVLQTSDKADKREAEEVEQEKPEKNWTNF